LFHTLEGLGSFCNHTFFVSRGITSKRMAKRREIQVKIALISAIF